MFYVVGLHILTLLKFPIIGFPLGYLFASKLIFSRRIVLIALLAPVYTVPFILNWDIKQLFHAVIGLTSFILLLTKNSEKQLFYLLSALLALAIITSPIKDLDALSFSRGYDADGFRIGLVPLYLKTTHSSFTGFASDPNFLMCVLLIFFSLSFREKKFNLLVLLGLALVARSTFFFGLTLALSMLICLRFKGRRQNKLLIFLFFICIVASIALSGNIRLVIWVEYIDWILNNEIIWFGIDNALLDYFYISFRPSHNTFIDLYLARGLLGLGFFLWSVWASSRIFLAAPFAPYVILLSVSTISIYFSPIIYFFYSGAIYSILKSISLFTMKMRYRNEDK